VDWLVAVRTALGDGWLFAVAALFYLIVQSGIIPKWMGGRYDEHARERAEAAEDRRVLIENYHKEAEDQRNWRAEDTEFYERKIARLEQLVENMSEAALLSERGNARLRHLVNNLFQHIAAMRAMERRAGRTPLPYDGWREALNISPDLDERLRDLFNDAGIEPPSTDS